MPEPNSRSMWGSYPTVTTFAISLLILALIAVSVFAFQAGQINDLKSSLSSLRTEIIIERARFDERDKSSRERDMQVIQKLDVSSKENHQIQESLDKIWQGMIVSGISDDVKGGKPHVSHRDP